MSDKHSGKKEQQPEEQPIEGEAQQPKLSRRSFLKTAAAGTAAGAISVPQNAIGALVNPKFAESPATQIRTDRFSRLFPNLPSQFPTTEPMLQRTKDALFDIGGFGHVLDAKDPIGRAPVELIVDPAASVNNPDNPNMTAGATFMGQFFDHDMTFDTTSFLGVPKRPEDSTNTRTPGFDLDSVYGGGPVATPQLYQPGDTAKLRIESGGMFEDVPRMSNGTAIIADPRNDENMMISGLQAAFIKFHNNVVDRLRSQGTPTSQLFSEARRLTRWHYQWLILKEFLPLFIGQDRVNAILSGGRRFYRPPAGQQSIPVEFQISYRFGHSMIRPSYRGNFTGNPNGTQFFGMIFVPDGEVGNPSDPVDLRGGARAARRFIGWPTFFNFGDGLVRNNKRIDTKISTALFRLPLNTLPGEPAQISLMTRNLLRHITWSLPSGQAIANAMGVQVLGASNFPELRGYGVGLDANTPLFYYVLKEAELLEQGLRLGPMASTMVGEVFIGLLQLDSNSFLRAQPSWTPTLPRRDGSTGDFRMVDFLTFAGVAGQR
jgi:hypothetical protein